MGGWWWEGGWLVDSWLLLSLWVGGGWVVFVAIVCLLLFGFWLGG